MARRGFRGSSSTREDFERTPPPPPRPGYGTYGNDPPNLPRPTGPAGPQDPSTPPDLGQYGRGGGYDPRGEPFYKDGKWHQLYYQEGYPDTGYGPGVRVYELDSQGNPTSTPPPAWDTPEHQERNARIDENQARHSDKRAEQYAKLARGESVFPGETAAQTLARMKKVDRNGWIRFNMFKAGDARWKQQVDPYIDDGEPGAGQITPEWREILAKYGSGAPPGAYSPSAGAPDRAQPYGGGAPDAGVPAAGAASGEWEASHPDAKALADYRRFEADLKLKRASGEITQDDYSQQLSAYYRANVLQHTYSSDLGGGISGDPGNREYQPQWIESAPGQYEYGTRPDSPISYSSDDPYDLSGAGTTGHWRKMAEGGNQRNELMRNVGNLNQGIADLQMAISRGMDEYGRPLAGDALAAKQAELQAMKQDASTKIEQIQTGSHTSQMLGGSPAHKEWLEQQGLSLGSYAPPAAAQGNAFTQGSMAAARMAQYRPDAFGADQLQRLQQVPIGQMQQQAASRALGDKQGRDPKTGALMSVPANYRPPAAPGAAQAGAPAGSGATGPGATAEDPKKWSAALAMRQAQGIGDQKWDWFGEGNQKKKRAARQSIIGQYGLKAFSQAADSEYTAGGYTRTPAQEAAKRERETKIKLRRQQGATAPPAPAPGATTTPLPGRLPDRAAELADREQKRQARAAQQAKQQAIIKARQDALHPPA